MQHVSQQYVYFFKGPQVPKKELFGRVLVMQQKNTGACKITEALLSTVRRLSGWQ